MFPTEGQHMQMGVALLTVLALAGFAPETTGHVLVSTTAELVVSEDDTVSGTAEMLVGLDEAAWDEVEDGPAEDAAPEFEFTEADLEQFEAAVAGLDGVTTEMVARGDDPFGQSGLTIGFEETSFEAFNTALERLNAADSFALELALVRQAGEPSSPEGGGPQHVLGGAIDVPEFEIPPEIDLDVDVTVTFAGIVYDTNGEQGERTVIWTDRGDVIAVASPEEHGNPWQLWLLLGAVVVLMALRFAQQGNRRTRERHGEIPPLKSEVDGFQPIHR